MTLDLAFHCHMEDPLGATVFSNLPPACLKCAKNWQGPQTELTEACGERGARRRGLSVGKEGRVFLCTPDKDAIKSARVFKRELAFLGSLMHRVATIREELAKQETAKARRLIHNLISLNAHSLQDLYSVVSQDDLASFARQKFRSQKDIIRERLMADPDAAASLFVRTLRNEGALKNELSVFKRLYDGAASPPKRSSHSIHKVIFNVANYFFQDFADKTISTRIEDCDEKVEIDYESVQVALYHILENATKYCAPGSKLRIHFSSSESNFCVLLDMTSCHVKDAERNDIYQEGFSGSVPKKAGTAGQGLGMGMVRELLRLNSAEIDANWGIPLKPTSDGILYSYNTIVIRFRKG